MISLNCQKSCSGWLTRLTSHSLKYTLSRQLQFLNRRMWCSHHFSPKEVRKKIIDWFEHFHPTPNLNRGRLSGTAASLTFGAQTGRGSDRSCVIKRTLDHDYYPLITLVHELAQNAAGAALPYLGFQILRLGPGQKLNQHNDYHNHADYPNHTMKFGKYTGGSLQMLRDGQWHSYDTECQWMSFDALKVVHRVTPVGKGARYSITLYTPESWIV